MADLAACKLPDNPSREINLGSAKHPNLRPDWMGVSLSAEETKQKYSVPIETILKNQEKLEVVVIGKPKFEKLSELREEFRKRHSDSKEIELNYSRLFGTPPKGTISLLGLEEIDRVAYLMEGHSIRKFGDRQLEDKSVVALGPGATKGDLLFGIMQERTVRKTYPALFCNFEKQDVSAANLTQNLIEDSRRKLENLKFDTSTSAGREAWTDYSKALSVHQKNLFGIPIDAALDLLANSDAFKLNGDEKKVLRFQVEFYLNELDKSIEKDIKTAASLNAPKEILDAAFAELKKLNSNTAKWIKEN